MANVMYSINDPPLPPPEPPEKAPPLLLHVDVNKTIVLSDSAMGKSVEYTVREVIASNFWGWVSYNEGPDVPEGQEWSWMYDGRGAQDDPEQPPAKESGQKGEWPANIVKGKDVGRPYSYMQFCRVAVKDKSYLREAIRSFDLVKDAACKAKMEELVAQMSGKMKVPEEMRTPKLAEETGLNDEWLLVFPSFCKMVAMLQRERRNFCVFFRSFGHDLGAVCKEWNAFCEGRHALYDKYLEGVGKMDGTISHVPDRRVKSSDMHTMYRDVDGPLLALNVSTNGVNDGDWDKWGKSKSSDDTRNGRAFLQEMGVETVEGYNDLRAWIVQQVQNGKSLAIKDDYAWWHHGGEVSLGGKLLLDLPGVRSIFFDDNIGNDEGTDAKIIDCRDQNFSPIDFDETFERFLCRVNPLWAILDEDYFFKLIRISDRKQMKEPVRLAKPALHRRSVMNAFQNGPSDSEDLASASRTLSQKVAGGDLRIGVAIAVAVAVAGVVVAAGVLRI